MKDRIDAILAAAMHDVPVPQGLDERLLTRLNREVAGGNNEAASRIEEAGTIHSSLPLPGSSSPLPNSHIPISTLSRRWLLAGGGLLAMAAGLLVAVWLGASNGENLTEQYVLAEAIRSFVAATGEPGHLLAEKPAPAGYPFSAAVLLVRGATWRPLDGSFLGRRGVVYDLPGRAGTSAALYVLNLGAVEGSISGAVPAYRPFTTAGCSASSWQEGRLLYVLVVQGDPATYRAYLNLPRGPVA